MIEVSSFSGNFVQVPHSFLRDKNLSSEARFLGVYLASLPTNWEVSWEQVAYEIGWSYAKVRKIAKELISEGVLEREEVRDEAGRFCGKSNTKITYKQDNLFENAKKNERKDEQTESSLESSAILAKNTEAQGAEVAKNGNAHRVLQNPHVDFVQHKNKDLKEQRDYISRAHEAKENLSLQKSKTKSNPTSQKPSESYKIFNRHDLKLNIWQLFGQGKNALKQAQSTPQGLDNAGLKAWNEFVIYRRSLRQFSGLAKTRAAKKFEEFYALGIDLSQAVDIAISRGWFCFWDKQGNLITGQKPKSQNPSANYPQVHNYQNAQKHQTRPTLDWRAAIAKAQNEAKRHRHTEIGITRQDKKTNEQKKE